MPFTRVESGYYAADMARANWFLPDDDPRKITHKTVERLRAIAGAIGGADLETIRDLFTYWNKDSDVTRFRDHLAADIRRDVDLLAALLPPER